jgi:hypothetical protein
MSLRQLRTRTKHLEHVKAESREPVHNEECAARSRLEELRLRLRKQENRPNEVERPLTAAEEAELDELIYRFDPLGPAYKAWKEAADKEEKRSREWIATRTRSRSNES